MSDLDLAAIRERLRAAWGWVDGVGGYGMERRVAIDASLADIEPLVQAVEALEALLVDSRQFAIHHPGAGCTDAVCACGVIRYLDRLNHLLGYGPRAKHPDPLAAADALWTALRNAKGQEPYGPDIIDALVEYEEARGLLQ